VRDWRSRRQPHRGRDFPLTSVPNSSSEPVVASAAPPRRNRFARYRKTTLCVTVLVLLGLIELACYLIIVFKGHRDLRFAYPYNRILSGYTVFENVPGHSFRTSAIKSNAAEPDPILDEHGFLHDTPVSREKPAGTFRIFLVGGSTAFGAGQNIRYHSVHPYLDGLYAYPSSIAGQLQSYLQTHNPATHYEVINAAGFERRIHQSLIQYIETLSQFQPDLIINLDGMNDVYSLVTGTPFADLEQQLPFYVELYQGQRSLLRYSSTYYVLSTLYSKWVNRQRSAEPAPTTEGIAKGSGISPVTPLPSENSGHAFYEKSKDSYTKNAQRLLQIVRQYFAILKADRTPSIFVLQPLLNRAKKNKHLSEVEQKLAGVMVPAGADASAAVDQCALLLTYFYDDYLSDALRKTAKESGIEYIDMNAEIANLGPDVEFYTDYCHLTPEGNRRVAEILGKAILAMRRDARH
jgi:lysophospholipase L1-like esterase